MGDRAILITGTTENREVLERRGRFGEIQDVVERDMIKRVGFVSGYGSQACFEEQVRISVRSSVLGQGGLPKRSSRTGILDIPWPC